MDNYLPLIIGMGIVTAIPRIWPLLFLKNKKLNPKLKKFLQYIPYTSLTILVIRGILMASRDMFIPTIIGIGISGIIAYYKNNLVLSVLGGISAAFIIINLF